MNQYQEHDVVRSPIDWDRVENDAEYRKLIRHPDGMSARKLARAKSGNRDGYWAGYPGDVNSHQYRVLQALDTATTPLSRKLIANLCELDKERIGQWIGLSELDKREVCERVNGVVSLVTRGYAEIVTENVPPPARLGYQITPAGKEFLRSSVESNSRMGGEELLGGVGERPGNSAYYDELGTRRGSNRFVEAPGLAVASDIVSPPDRVECTITRIIRDSALALDLKQRHNFECQICGETIALPDGRRYAEAHHIQPLGGEHAGVDTIGNMLCLCPNHHAELDLGVRKIVLGSMRSAPGHDVDPTFVEYHNSHIALLQ